MFPHRFARARRSSHHSRLRHSPQAVAVSGNWRLYSWGNAPLDLAGRAQRQKSPAGLRRPPKIIFSNQIARVILLFLSSCHLPMIRANRIDAGF
jgi:hypothetical protein